MNYQASLIVFLIFACSFAINTPLLFAGESGVESADARQIKVKGGRQQPSWMESWNAARAARNSGDLATAKLRYQTLIKEKANIEEARREYAHLLLHLESYEEAFTVLQGLIELNPDSLEYLLHAGEAALQLQRYNRAASFLGQVYTIEPNGPHALDALRGQIIALQKQGQKELAYPLMEQLYLLIPNEEELIRLLAIYSAELGQKDKAVTYYQKLINEFTPTAEDLLAGEKLFTENKLDDLSLVCWKKYIQSHPYHIPFHQKLAAYYIANEQKEEALDHLLVIVAHGTDDPFTYLQIGQIFLYDLGRPDKALYYYDEYRKRVPQNESIEQEIAQIQSVLANDLLVIVENSGAWNLWRDLAKVIPDRLAVYYSMAEQLQHLNKPKELREVLEIIHLHNPTDQAILLQLALLLYNEKEYARSRDVLEVLDENHRDSTDYFLLLGRILEREGDITSALQAYQAFFRKGGDDSRLLVHSLELSARTGDVGVLDDLFHRSQNEEKNKEIRITAALLYGEILVTNCLYSKARKFYSHFPFPAEQQQTVEKIIAIQHVRILQGEGKYFEAEQKLRSLLINAPHSQEYLQLLVKNSLQARDWDNAWRWHQYRKDESREQGDLLPEQLEELFVEELSLLAQSDQLDLAIDDAEDYLFDTGNSVKVKRILAELYYQDKQYVKAQEILLSIPDNEQQYEQLLRLIERNSRIVQTAQGTDQEKLCSLQCARYYLHYQAYQEALVTINTHIATYGKSVEGRVLKAKILQAMGDDFHALQIYEELLAQYPEEEFFRMQTIQINFDRSKFANVIQALDPESKSIPNSSHLLTKQNVLLLARSYWALKQQKKALAIYAEFLQPPVDILFSKKLKEHDITLELPAPQRTFLNKITFTTPSQPNRLRVVMQPNYIREHKGKPVLDVITSLYADYRWQQLVQRELGVRQSMHDGNYYQAMNEYQKMLKNQPSMESLYDLAGIYSRLGFLGKEAALYGIIQQESPGYPYLDEAMERNRLKREPRVSPLYEFGQQEGRQGYLDNQQHSFGVSAWYMPSLNHVLSLDYRRIYNRSIDGEADIWRNRINAEVNWSPSYDFDLFTKFGMDGGASAGQSTLLYDFTLQGKIGDQILGFARVAQDVVDDTVESLVENISVTEYETGLQFDILPRWFAGGKYQFSDYSDANYKNSFDIWSSYTLFPEPLLLQIRYEYGLSHNNKGNKKKEFELTGVYGPNDHPYWSPKEYWQHTLNILFEHQLTDDTLGRGAPSYYSLDYSFGYEDGGNINHIFNAQIFLEISRHFLLNTSFNYLHGESFENTKANVSLIYRW